MKIDVRKHRVLWHAWMVGVACIPGYTGRGTWSWFIRVLMLEWSFHVTPYDLTYWVYHRHAWYCERVGYNHRVLQITWGIAKRHSFKNTVGIFWNRPTMTFQLGTAYLHITWRKPWPSEVWEVLDESDSHGLVTTRLCTFDGKFSRSWEGLTRSMIDRKLADIQRDMFVSIMAQDRLTDTILDAAAAVGRLGVVLHDAPRPFIQEDHA